MGYEMALRLVSGGFAVAGQDPDTGAVARFLCEFGAPAFEPRSADMIITCVTNESAIESLLLGDGGLLRSAGEGQLFIDHTTTSPAFSRQAHQIAKMRGAQFVDAPMSGGKVAAVQGDLSVFVGGEDDSVTRALPVLQCYATRITRLGFPGAGQTGKLANQIAIAGIVRGLQEATSLAHAAGLNLQELYDALGAGSARSEQLQQHRFKLSDSELSFRDNFRWMEKDLTLALAEAEHLGLELPASRLIQALLKS